MHFSAFMGVSQAAAGALVAAVWQGFLLAVVAWAGLKLLPKTPAAVRFAIWFAVFLVVAGLPVVSLLPHAPNAAGHGAWLTLDARWCVAIVAVWGVASLVRAGTLGVAALRLRALWKRAEVVEVAVPMGVRGARVCVSDEVDRPSVIGFFSPKILIPRWLIEKLTADELQQIVLHETGHLARADDWVNLLQKIALVLFPLNPALIWVERRLCFERELACDERVLRETGAPKAYAACLAGLAEYRLGRRGGALSLGALGRESQLGQRVGRILAGGRRMKAGHARLVLAGAMLGLMAGTVELARCPSMVAFTSPAELAQIGVAPSHADKAAVNGAPKVQAVVFHVSRAASEDGSARRGMTARTHISETRHGAPDWMTARPDRRRQLVVMTDWDGSRVVMTAAQASDMAQVASEDQVPRYAAVPVRGGWLVFQL